MSILIKLKRREDFISVAMTQYKCVMPGLILQAALLNSEQRTVRIGFTVSRKVGNAVQRNRARRRLRAVAEDILPRVVVGGYDLVLIGRTRTLQRSYMDLRTDLKTAVQCLGLS